MGRRAKDLRLENLKENLLGKISNEEEPSRLKELLSCYKQVVSILEHQEEKKAEKKQARLAIPK